MNEIALSDNLNQIELEIKHHKNVAGQSIWEIGRRLNHVKENDLAHGEFTEWTENKLGINYRQANRFMKVAKEISKPNMTTLSHLGESALYLIATLPEEERNQEQLTADGESKKPDEMTVRELQELKKQLNEKEAQLKQAKRSEEIAISKLEEEQNKDPKVIEKQITIERVPEDYDSLKGNFESMKKTNEYYKEQNAELRQELDSVSESYKGMNKNSKGVDAEEIKRLEEQKINLERKIEESENIEMVFEKVKELMMELYPLLYERNNVDGYTMIIDAIKKWTKDMEEKIDKLSIIEGEFLE